MCIRDRRTAETSHRILCKVIERYRADEEYRKPVSYTHLKLLFQPLRVAVCGNRVSPPLFEAMMLMDPADIVARIDGVTETVFSERAN